MHSFNDERVLQQWRQFIRNNLKKNISPKLKSAIRRSDTIRYAVSKELLK